MEKVGSDLYMSACLCTELNSCNFCHTTFTTATRVSRPPQLLYLQENILRSNINKKQSLKKAESHWRHCQQIKSLKKAESHWRHRDTLFQYLLDRCTSDVLVEGPGEVTLHQLVVIDRLGNDTANKLEVAQMVAVTVWRSIDCVCDTVSRRGTKQGIHWVENLAGNDDVPLTQQTSSILTIFS